MFVKKKKKNSTCVHGEYEQTLLPPPFLFITE